jgi:hypothetical protein
MQERRPVESLPANAGFLPYDELSPKTDVYLRTR